MDIELGSFSTSEDTRDSIREMIELLGAKLCGRATELPSFESIKSLSLNPHTIHPIHTEELSRRPIRYFEKEYGTYFVECRIDYLDWVSTKREDRVRAFSRALESGVKAIPKSRLNQGERNSLFSLILEVEDFLIAQGGADLKRLNPIYLSVGVDGDVNGVAYQLEPTQNAKDYLEVLPEKAKDYIGALDHWYKPDQLSFQFYKKGEGALRYHHVTYHESRLTEYVGVCGFPGELTEHSVTNEEQAIKLVSELKKTARKNGFKNIPPSRWKMLMVEYPLDNASGDCGLGNRHEYEDLFEQLLITTGLGYCDGGSSGSGTMEVFVEVVDAPLAKRVIEKAFAGKPVGQFSSISTVK